jgi:hypothetical protein
MVEHHDDGGQAPLPELLRREFRVRSWWPGMDSFDSARGETEPHPLAEEAAAFIEQQGSPPFKPGPLLADLLEKQRQANPMAGPWVDLDEHGRKVVLDWLIGTCLAFGASIGTAYQVAGLFAAGLDREAAARSDR